MHEEVSIAIFNEELIARIFSLIDTYFLQQMIIEKYLTEVGFAIPTNPDKLQTAKA